MFKFGRNMAAFEPVNEKHLVRCPVCEKMFQPAPEHIYNITVDKQKKLVCSYSCQRLWQKEPSVAKKTARKTTKVRCVESGQVFGSVRQCAEEMETEPSIISKCLRSGQPYKGFHFEGE